MPGYIYYGHLMLTPIFWSFFGIFGAFDVLLPASAASQSPSRGPPRVFSGGGGGVRFNRGGVLMLRFWCQDGPGVSIIHTKSQPSRHISVSFQSFKMSKHSSHCLSAGSRKHIAERPGQFGVLWFSVEFLLRIVIWASSSLFLKLRHTSMHIPRYIHVPYISLSDINAGVVRHAPLRI